MRIKRIFLALATLFFLTCSHAVHAVTDAAPMPAAVHGVQGERRVMFDEAITWATSKHAADQILDRLKAAGINTYVPCIWHGRGTFYPSALGKPDPRLAKTVESGEDMLDYLIKRAHAMGIQVHPWFTVALREDQQFPQFAEAGTPEGKYNIHDAKFRAFMHSVMMDVVKRYPIDGVNLDYVRAGGFCLADSCIEDYRKKFDRSLRMDLLLRKIPGVRIESLTKWNQQSVNDIISHFAAEAKRLRPNLVISVDATPMRSNSDLQGQDSIAWANKGWVDVIYNMDYAPSIDVERGLKVRAALREPNKLVMLVALYDLEGKLPISRQPQQVIDYIDISRKQFAASGIAFYHLPRLSDAQISALQSGPFKAPASAVTVAPSSPRPFQ